MPAKEFFAPTRYIDPLVDFAFKKIFGSEPNKDLLIDFLNEVFRGQKRIADLTYGKNEHPGATAKEGGAIFDLMCTADNGEQFIIEVQRGSQQYFKERALFYTSRLISGQAPKGNRNKWAYNLKEVYLIALLEDFTVASTPAGEYLHDIALCNRQTGEIFYDKLGYTYIELRNFVKTEDELQTDLDKWLYVLKHLSTMQKLPTYLRKPVFKKLFTIAEYSNLTKEEQMKYDSSMKYKWDNENVLEYAIKKAKEEGKQEGKQEGKKEGKEEGKQEGKQEGEHLKAVAIATEMKNDKMPVAQISKFTGLSVEEIEKL